MSKANITPEEKSQREVEDGTSTHKSAIHADEFFNFELISFRVRVEFCHDDVLTGLIQFKVETTVFRVITRGLVAPGSAFEVMLSLPNANHGEGSCNEKPILLEGVQEGHFRAFLRVLYGDL